MELADIMDNEIRNIVGYLLNIIENNVAAEYQLEIINYVLAIIISDRERKR